MNITIRQLRHLVVLSEERHFSRAADRLALTQPALSRSIRAIEDAYGIRLIERDPSGSGLTRAGEEVVRLARITLQNVAHLDETLRAEAGGSAGNVFAGIAPLPAGAVLSDICTRVLTRRPGIRLYTDIQPNASLAENLIAARYDFILCPPLALRELHDFDVTPAGSIPFDMIVRAGHPLDGRDNISIEDINAFPVIGAHTRAVGRPAEFDPGTGFYGLGPLSLTSDSYDVLTRVVLSTDAVCMSSRKAVHAELASGKLATLPKTGLPFPDHVDLAIVTLRGSSLSPATQRVINDIVEFLASADVRAATR